MYNNFIKVTDHEPKIIFIVLKRVRCSQKRSYSLRQDHHKQMSYKILYHQWFLIHQSSDYLKVKHQPENYPWKEMLTSYLAKLLNCKYNPRWCFWHILLSISLYVLQQRLPILLLRKEQESEVMLLTHFCNASNCDVVSYPSTVQTECLRRCLFDGFLESMKYFFWACGHVFCFLEHVILCSPVEDVRVALRRGKPQRRLSCLFGVFSNVNNAPSTLWVTFFATHIWFFLFTNYQRGNFVFNGRYDD